MNIILLVGRLTQQPEMRTIGDNHNVCYITLAVKRDFKNSDGTYETDFVPVTLWEGVGQLCTDYCRKGSMISLKGRIAIVKREVNGKTINCVDIVGEKIAILHHPKQGEEE